MYKTLLLAVALFFATGSSIQAGELAGVTVDDRITNANGTALQLNGMGLREKFWIDVYVGSLYLPIPTHNAAEAIEQAGAFRVRMDILYTEISGEKLVDAWQEGFEKNQSPDALAKLEARIKQFNALFADSARKGDRIMIDYIPTQGTRVLKNDKLLGTVEGDDFKKALLAIWLGNVPADAQLKAGMLGKSGE